MSKARDISKSTETLDVDGGTIKLDGNHPVGTNNVALGNTALDSNVSGASNTAIGADALTANTASDNTAVGYQAGYSNTTGTDLVAVGVGAAYSQTTAAGNMAIGQNALRLTTTGVGNTALGTQHSGVSNSSLYFNTTGSYNTAVGTSALFNNTTASSNTAVGYQAGYTITTGSKNTILGRYNGNQGGLDIRTSNNNIVLSDGDGNPRLFVDGTGRFRVNGCFGQTGGVLNINNFENVAHCLDLGTQATGIDTLVTFRGATNSDGGGGTTRGTITITSSSTSYNTTSDYRLKENVVELTGATERLKQIPVHRFNFIADPDTTVDGFLAHEVQSVVPEAIHGTKDEVDADGNPVYQGIDQSKLVPLLVATIKELEARITALETN